MSTEKFQGKSVNIGGEIYVIPPLALGQLRNGGMDLIKQHDAVANEMAEATRKGESPRDGAYFELLDLRAKVIALAFKRNYPDAEENIVLDGLDTVNVNELWLWIIGMSGFRPGEAKPGA